MDGRKLLAVGGIGCGIVGILALGAAIALVVLPMQLFQRAVIQTPILEEAQIPTAIAEQAQPTFTLPAPPTQNGTPPPTGAGLVAAESAELIAFYDQFGAGVVNIQTLSAGNMGGGAGSGFVLDAQGHIVTNNHVIADAVRVTVVFNNGFESLAEITGADPDSDLAVLTVEEMPEGVTPLSLGDSDAVRVGEWVIAIGNPFGLGSSMSLGIVSAVGRMIASGATPYSIPSIIQTDAAINPGNSGGPLLNQQGQVIGVNAQIASRSGGNTGVGFAIPSSIVRRVVPTLIEGRPYQWPWLGIQGTSVNLIIMEANDLGTQFGAYIDNVIANSPAAEAGLRGSDDNVEVEGVPLPVGGDVIIAADGRPVENFSDLLYQVALKRPGETISLTVLRGGQEETIDVELQPRPGNFQQNGS